jgi:hypothetical protein
MTEALDVSAPLAERPPFDQEQDGAEDDMQADDGPTVPVAEALALAADLGFAPADFIELALCSIAEVAAELTEDLEADEIAADPTTVAILERLQIGAQILAEVDLGEDPDEDQGGEGEGGEVIAAEWEGEEDHAEAA